MENVIVTIITEDTFYKALDYIINKYPSNWQDNNEWWPDFISYIES